MRGHPDPTSDRAPERYELDFAIGEPFIDLAARLSPGDPPSIRSRLARRHSSGLRERLARPSLGAPIR